MVFVNDVWVCAGDVIRLLHHRRAHIACGMDFDRPTLQQMPRSVIGTCVQLKRLYLLVKLSGYFGYFGQLLDHLAGPWISMQIL